MNLKISIYLYYRYVYVHMNLKNFQKLPRENKVTFVSPLKFSDEVLMLVKKKFQGSSLPFPWEAHVYFRDLFYNLENE